MITEEQIKEKQKARTQAKEEFSELIALKKKEQREKEDVQMLLIEKEKEKEREIIRNAKLKQIDDATELSDIKDILKELIWLSFFQN